MHYSKSATDQLNRIFQDHFKKWPDRFKWSVFFCFFFPLASYLAQFEGYIAPSFLNIMIVSLLTINAMVVFWGVALHNYARRYWHTNYHVYTTTSLAIIPLALLIFQYVST